MGKYNQCLMPSKDVKDRFLEDWAYLELFAVYNLL